MLNYIAKNVASTHILQLKQLLQQPHPPMKLWFYEVLTKTNPLILNLKCESHGSFFLTLPNQNLWRMLYVLWGMMEAFHASEAFGSPLLFKTPQKTKKTQQCFKAE